MFIKMLDFKNQRGLCVSVVCSTLKYFYLSFWGCMYFTIYIWLLLLHYIPKENNVLFTPYIFPDTQKYSLHVECLVAQENGPIYTLIKRTHMGIPIASDLRSVSVPLAVYMLYIREFLIICTFDT
jgi:hypothetical protein